MKIALRLLIGLAVAALLTTPVQGGATDARITRWTDGDTAHAAVDSTPTRVRLIGIDAPETSAGERAARQAAELNRDVATIVALGQ
jgi:endonuclease YncB( thermonuclease family)